MTNCFNLHSSAFAKFIYISPCNNNWYLWIKKNPLLFMCQPHAFAALNKLENKCSEQAIVYVLCHCILFKSITTEPIAMERKANKDTRSTWFYNYFILLASFACLVTWICVQFTRIRFDSIFFSFVTAHFHCLTTKITFFYLFHLTYIT